MLPDQALLVLAHSGVKEAEYHLGLIYCTQNDPVKALYWLKQSAFQGYQKAIDTIHEMLEKNLI